MTTKRTIEEWGKRYLVLCVGLWIMSLGVACSIKGALGTSPISSLPYAMSGFLPLTVGTCTIIMHVGFILLQILILRRQYDPMQLIQLPVALLFGYLTDFALWAVDWIQCTAYWQQWLVCLAGICLVAVGVSCEVIADVAVLAGEGVVLAVCKVAPIQFSAMKVIFDVTLVVSACALSLMFTGEISGVREGTLAAALLVGTLTRQIRRLMGRLEDWFTAQKPKIGAESPQM